MQFNHEGVVSERFTFTATCQIQVEAASKMEAAKKIRLLAVTSPTAIRGFEIGVIEVTE